MPEFRRAEHARVAAALGAMDAGFLATADTYFGGGTQIVMANAEYRVSRDIDFLCASPAGYRRLRETVSERSLGALCRHPLALAREVRADRDGIRTFIADETGPIKFEIVLEARIELTGALDTRLAIPVLDAPSAVAEKLLANADRGLDRTFRSRDLVDLAFLHAAHGAEVLAAGLQRAKAAYGAAILRALKHSLDLLERERGYLRTCINDLLVDDEKRLKRGLAGLRAFAKKSSAGK